MSVLSREKIELTGQHHSSLEQARGRLTFLTAFFIVAYIIVGARVLDLGVLQSVSHADQQNVLYEYSVSQPISTRNDVVDRNGVILARSLKMRSLYADPVLVVDPKRAAQELVKIFPELSYGSLFKKLQSKKRFVWVARNVTPQQQAEVLELGLPALSFKEEEKRIYPQGNMLPHILGITGVDGHGLSGIEKSFDSYLRDVHAQALALTIDVRVQYALRREISNAMSRHKAKAGAGIVMDVNTGEVLATVSLPDFDLHHYDKSSDAQKFNRATLGVYELGSTFKIFSTAAYLEMNDGNVAQWFDAREPMEVGRFKIRDYHPEKRHLSLPEVFIHSSNIGSAKMGEAVGTPVLKKFYADLGLLNAPEFEIPEVGKPIVPNPWREINTLTSSYGHGIAVSPLQLTQAVASIVNGGVLVQPTLIKHGQRQENASEKEHVRPEVRIISPQTSHRMRQLMRLVVTQGTGSKADVEGFLVGGKTGTAEKPGKGGYDRKKLISSFVAVFPMDAPKYAVFIMIDEPQGIKETYGYATGGWVAAPAVSNVIRSMVGVMGLQPEQNDQGFEKSLLRYVKTKEEIKQDREKISEAF